MQAFSGKLSFGRSYLPQVAISAIVHNRFSSSITAAEHQLLLTEDIIAFLMLKMFMEVKPVEMRYGLSGLDSLMMYFTQ